MMLLRRKWLVMWSLWAARLVPQPTDVIKTNEGLLRGMIAPDGSHAQYYGIPYASSNYKDRFQGPQKVTKWEGIFNAYDEHIRCLQRFGSTRTLGRENCLTLNVYTPINRKHLLPVMVFIHGGGFRDGSGSPFLYGPDYFIHHEVILVTFNYRLEIIGFLCLGIKEAPGNAGLKDQVEAMKWVKRNIRAFGGDPENITIFGESAGSASVVYHLTSPMSRGLFNKAIMQSGSAMSPWSLQFEPLKTASLLAKQLGYNTNDPYEIHRIFMNKTPTELLTTRVPRSEGDIVLSENIFVPCIEKETSGVERFLSDSPYNLILKDSFNEVPLIIGFNSAEGFMFVGKENDTTIAKLDFYKALPRDLTFSSEREKIRTARKIKDFYMGNKKITRETLADFARYEGDSSITYPVIFTIDLLSKKMKQPIYAYKISYDGWLNLAKLFFGYFNYPGTTHADELFYMFKVKVTLPITFIEKKFINKITTFWTNFAKFGNPTPAGTLLSEWKPVMKENPEVLEINEECKVIPLWEDDIMKFWNKTYTKYRRKE